MIVGFNFTKMSAERNDLLLGNINISNNVGIESVEEKELALGKTKQKGLRFVFNFTSKYDNESKKEVGKLLIGGEIIVIEEPDKIKSILKDWKDKKAIDKDVMTQVINTALAKSNVQALIMSQTINLPPPIPMPKVSTNPPKDKNYIG